MRLALLLLTVGAPALAAQPSPTRIAAAGREIAIAARYAAFITRGPDGSAQARTVDPLLADTGFAVWIATNPSTRKVAEIRRDPRVTLYWFDGKSESYLTLKGRARLVTDPAERNRHWKAEWSPFYPDRRRAALIAVQPLGIEVVSPSRGVVGDSVSWRPPSVRLSGR